YRRASPEERHTPSGAPNPTRSFRGIHRMPLDGSGILHDPPAQPSTLSAGPKRDQSAVGADGPFEFFNCTARKVSLSVTSYRRSQRQDSLTSSDVGRCLSE